MEKSGLQRAASRLGVMVIAPDTSPRGDDVPNDDVYDLGQGAGFYLSATQAPWSGITGHSMGGHGALTLHLKHPDLYRSVSAFSPIVAPSVVPWGEKAFSAYIGDDKSTWAQYDACELVKSAPSKADILIDTGDADPFLDEQLRPQLFIDACQEAGQE